MFEPLSVQIADTQNNRKKIPLDDIISLEYSYGYEAALNSIRRSLLNEASSFGCEHPEIYIRLVHGNEGQPDKRKEPGNQGLG